jgi:hypothetical protein
MRAALAGQFSQSRIGASVGDVISAEKRSAIFAREAVSEKPRLA